MGTHKIIIINEHVAPILAHLNWKPFLIFKLSVMRIPNSHDKDEQPNHCSLTVLDWDNEPLMEGVTGIIILCSIIATQNNCYPGIHVCFLVGDVDFLHCSPLITRSTISKIIMNMHQLGNIQMFNILSAKVFINSVANTELTLNFENSLASEAPVWLLPWWLLLNLTTAWHNH